LSIFEFVMIPPAIVLGLAMTHVLSGAGRVMHRLAGHGAPVSVDTVHLLWVTHVFLWMVFFWWYSYAWTTEFTWSLIIFIFLVAYAVAMYLMCVILVPSDMDPVSDFGSYFLSLRGWFFTGLIALILIDLADTSVKGLDHLLDIGWGYATMRAFLLAGSLVAMRTERRAFHLPFAAVSLVWMAAFFWIYRPVIADAGF
jgi:hypothetical protein